MTIFQSGGLYLVRRGDLGRIVPADGRPARGVAPFGSILAHCNVQDAWRELPDGEIPDVAAPVIGDAAGWEMKTSDG